MKVFPWSLPKSNTLGKHVFKQCVSAASPCLFFWSLICLINMSNSNISYLHFESFKQNYFISFYVISWYIFSFRVIKHVKSEGFHFLTVYSWKSQREWTSTEKAANTFCLVTQAFKLKYLKWTGQEISVGVLILQLLLFCTHHI